MSTDRRLALARAIIALAAPLVPAGARDDWRLEWDAELSSLNDVPPKYRRPIRRALGAFADAFWLRQRSIADFDWIDDVRHGSRQLAEHQGFALSAIGILAVGLAATVTMFSVTDQILLRALPYPDADRIVNVMETLPTESAPLEVSPGNYLDWKARATSFEHFAGVEPWAIDIQSDPRPEVWFSARVTDGFFESFGVTPLLGRFFATDEFQEGRDRVLVLSEPFWRQRFNGDPSVIGQIVKADDGPLTIIGVLPASFEPRLLATANGHRNVWQPKVPQEFEPRLRTGGYWAVVGRLRPGVAIGAAQAEMDAISKQLAVEYPRTNAKVGARVLSLREYLVGNVQLALTLLTGAVALVLLIACVNVANLLLARGSQREREIAIRLAIGARRGRVVQQLLTESGLIAFAGGLLGSVLATWMTAAIVRLGPTTVPWLETLHVDWRAIGFGIGMSAVVALIAGLLPAWRVAGASLATAGRQNTTADRAQHRLRAGLVAAEVALALMLITGAGLLARSFVGLLRVDPGFQRERVLVAQVFAWDYNRGPAALRTFFDNTLARLSAMPSVQASGAVSAMPFIESNIGMQGPITIASRPAQAAGEAPRSYLTVATPGYFEAMHIPLKGGRHLAASDGPATKKVAVITESLARHYWEGADPIGEILKFRLSGQPLEVEIVGIVGSLRHDSLDRGARDELFLPLSQNPFGSMTFVVRSAGDATSLLGPTRDAIWSVNPAQTIYRDATLDELVMKTVSPRRFGLSIVLTFAAVALLLSVVGVYGVLSAIMSARLREIGVRVALGASHSDIIRLVLWRGLAMTGIGVGIGLAASLASARLLESFLFEITPADPVSLVLAAAVMTLAAAFACYVPARRAAGADPVTVLRSD